MDPLNHFFIAFAVFQHIGVFVIFPILLTYLWMSTTFILKSSKMKYGINLALMLIISIIAIIKSIPAATMLLPEFYSRYYSANTLTRLIIMTNVSIGFAGLFLIRAIYITISEKIASVKNLSLALKINVGANFAWYSFAIWPTHTNQNTNYILPAILIISAGVVLFKIANAICRFYEKLSQDMALMADSDV